MDATFTIRPPPSASIARTTYFVRTMGDSVITRHEAQGAGLRPLRLLHRRRELGAFFPRHGDDAIPRPGEPARDAQPQAPAAARHQDITHAHAPACPSPPPLGPARSGSPPAPCAAAARRDSAPESPPRAPPP